MVPLTSALPPARPLCVTGSGPPAGAYKKEDAHWLLKASYVRGSGDVFVSKFENDTWGLDGYVSTCVRAAPVCTRASQSGAVSQLPPATAWPGHPSVS